MKRFVLSLLFASLFLSCKDDNDPGPNKIFTVTVDSTYPSLSAEDFWIMIHDSNGALLDAKQITEAGAITFQTSRKITDRVAITLFTITGTGSATKFYQFNTFSIPGNQDRTLSSKTANVENPPANNQTGIYTVDVTLPENVIMDNLVNGSMIIQGNVTSYTSGVYERGNNVLISVANGDEPRYTFFENVKNNDHFSVDFNTMQKYDYVLNLSFPLSKDPYVSVVGFDDNGVTQHIVYNNGSYLPPFADGYSVRNLKIGYLNRIKSYWTRISMAFDNYGLYYEKIGAKAGPFTIPDHIPYKMVNTSLADFSFTQELPFTYRESRFSILSQSTSQNFIDWTITVADGEAGTIREIASDLVKKYPTLILTNFKYRYSDFHTTSFSYNSYVESVLLNKGGKPSGDYEDFELQVY